MKFTRIALFAFLLLLSVVLVSCTNKGSEQETTGTAGDVTTNGDTAADTGNAEQTDAENTTASEETSSDASARINPVFSVVGGVYESDIALTVTVPEHAPAGTTVHYTTDGSIPTVRSKLLSADETLTLPGRSGTVVIRAVCVDTDGNAIGAAVTNTYIRAKSISSPLYRISITAPEQDLDRIIGNYANSDEIVAHIEMVNPAGERVISQDGGLRIFGGTSRALPQKSFKIIARKTERMDSVYYEGTGSFRYAFFENRTVRSGKNAGDVLDKYDSLILRNGGNDSMQHSSVDPNSATLLRDGLANNFAANVCKTLDYANSTFAAVYLNGEYYGILDLRENMNEDYVRRVYGVDDQYVDIVKSEVDTSRGGRFDGRWFYYESDSKAAIKALESLCRKAKNGMNRTGDDFRAVFDEIASKVDLESLKEYFALNLYICNTDWPHNNVKVWRYSGEAVEGISVTDGKWRFMTRDMDLGMGRYRSAPLPEIYTLADTDTFYRTLGNFVSGFADDSQLYPDSLGLQALFAFVLKDETFRQEFTDYCRLLASKENVTLLKNLYAESVSQISSEIPVHIKRWKSTLGGYTAKTWKSAHQEIEQFIDARPAYFLTYLDQAMSLVSKK